MDEPTARRRRHADSGDSVTVADLLAKSTPAEQASVSAIQARAAAEATARLPAIRPSMPLPAWAPEVEDYPDDPDDPSGEGRLEDGGAEPRTSYRLTTTIVVMVVAMVAAGVVAGFVALQTERSTRLSPSSPTVQPAALTGSAVVRPSKIIEELRAGTVTPMSTRSPAPSDPADAGPLADREAAERLVMDFFENVERRAAEAFALLGPGMQGDGQATFEDDWRSTNYVDPSILPSQDGAVRVHVSISQLNESAVIRLVARMEVRPVRVGGTAQLRIVDAQLLSAYRG